MPLYARREIVSPDQTGVYHCISRCVRRSFLCGSDKLSGKNYDHRKTWIRDRMEFLASLCGIEICGYAVLSNHFHVILRIRPDLVRNWSADEVALRWWRLHPRRLDPAGKAAEPEPHELDMLKADPQRLAELRLRLGSISWFMREINERIAREANFEDRCSGRFWEGRFKSQALLDDAAMLTCGIYVDLNPIRAGIAETPEESQFTSAHDRIKSLVAEPSAIAAADSAVCSEAATVVVVAEFSTPPKAPAADAWLCKLTLDESHAESPVAAVKQKNDVINVNASVSPPTIDSSKVALAPRASKRGFLPMSLTKYLKLLDWTGCELRKDKRGRFHGIWHRFWSG